MVFTRVVSLALVCTLVLGACGSGQDSVTVDDAWGRTSPAAASNAAFYLDIAGGSDADTLESANAAICGVTELHLSVATDGVMSMQPLPEGIDIPAAETVKLEPGSFHVMCIDTQQDLVSGDSVELTLDFTDAGTMVVDVEIRDE